MSPTEIIAAGLGIINVVLIVRRSVWNYPFGLAMVVLYAIVFFNSQLYANAALQVFFFGIQVYGWWHWLKNREASGLVRVSTLTATGRLVAIAAAVGLTLLFGWYLAARSDDPAPWWDGAIAAISVVAQALLSFRRIESWVLWIGVDVLAIYLFWVQGLYPTVALYAAFLGLAIAGLLAWWRALQREANEPSSTAGNT